MKILLVNNYFSRKGGAESVFHNTAELLASKGHKVITLSLDENKYKENEELGRYFVNEKSLYHNQFYSFEAAKKIKSIIKKEKPDIAHIHSVIGRLTFSILPALKKNNIPVVATIHDFRLLCPAYLFLNSRNEICEKCIGGNYLNCVINGCSPKGRIHGVALALESYYRSIFLPFAKYIDDIVFVSDFYRKKFISRYPALAEKNCMIYNFAAKIEFEENDRNYFFYLGRIIKIKGLLTLIKAFKGTDKLSLKVAGEGDLMEPLKKMSVPNVEFLGFKNQEELRNLLRNCSYTIVPSECYENNPMAIIESFSMGRPVIGAAIGGITELITDGKEGFLFEPGNIEQLKDVLNRAAKLSETDYNNMCLNAYHSAESNFNRDYHYERLNSVYEKAITKAVRK